MADGHIVEIVELHDSSAIYLLAQADVALASGATQRYLVPISLVSGADPAGGSGPLVSFMIAQVRRGARLEGLFDGIPLPQFPLPLVPLLPPGPNLSGQSRP